MRRWRRSLLLALLVVAATATIWWQRAEGPAPTSPSPAVAAKEPPMVAVTAAAGAAASAAPPAETPASVVVAQLREAADGGQGAAACRIAIELLTCINAAMSVETLLQENAEANATADGDGNVRRHVDEMQVRSIEQHNACQPIPESLQARAADYLTAAAYAGQVEALIRYVDGQHLAGRASHDYLGHPGFDDWRRDAPAMLQRLFRAGEPEAVYLLWISSHNDYGLLPALIPDDLPMALAYHHLMNRLSGGAEPRQDYGLDARAQQRARELAARWHEEYFGGRRFPEGATMRRLRPLGFGLDDAGRRPCAD